MEERRRFGGRFPPKPVKLYKEYEVDVTETKKKTMSK